jgi:hypothetical protein
VNRLAALVVATACGDNLSATDARVRDTAIDTSSGTPDLALVADQMDGTALVTSDSFTALDCEIVEGCIDAIGTRRLLRFDTVTANNGTGDLDLGSTPPPGVSSGLYVWSPCHMHHHVAGYADFSLRDGSDAVVIAGHKQAFCLEDDEQIAPGTPSHGFRCTHQGISVGWADVYSRVQPCQWIDVTDVAPGTYTLRVEIDVGQVFNDADRSNNVWSNTVSL